jgi:hypothetical protein
MTETQERPCRAKKPAECRFHRSDVFAKDAVEMYILAGHSEVDVETEAHLRVVAERVFAGLNHDLLEGRIDVEYVEGFRSTVSPLFEVTSWGIDTQQNGKFASGRLANAAYYQFQRTVKSDRPESEVNVLTSDDTTPFNRSAAAMLQKEGGWVTPFDDGFYGGWEDEMGTSHLQKCGASYMSEPVEDQWEFFAGTFADSNNIQHGMSAQVECNCGALKGEVRVMGNLSKLIRKLVNTYSL